MSDQIERELTLRSDADVVWRAVTDPEWLAMWLADEVTLEPEPGGEATFTTDGETRKGWIEEIVAPAGDTPGRLTFWWQAESEPASRVCIEVAPAERGTQVRVRETRPLELLDLVGVPLRGAGGAGGGPAYGPALVAAGAVTR